MYADRGYDHDIYRRRLRERNIKPKVARRGQGSGLGRVRWVAESAIAHLHGPRRFKGSVGNHATTYTMPSSDSPTAWHSPAN